MTATRERAINLRDWEVRAQQEGRLKMLVRRVKPQPESVGPNSGQPIREVVPSLLVNLGDLFDVRYDGDNPIAIRCPYGKPGDRLRGREVWRAKSWSEEGWGEIGYRADGNVAIVEGPWSFTQMYPFDMLPDVWRSAVLMPRFAIRNWLEITEVRCGRAQEMSEDEAVAAGFVSTVTMNEDHDDYYGSYASEQFARQYDADHGEGAWERDWVWMIGIKRIEGGK